MRLPIYLKVFFSFLFPRAMLTSKALPLKSIEIGMQKCAKDNVGGMKTGVGCFTSISFWRVKLILVLKNTQRKSPFPTHTLTHKSFQQ